MPKGHRAPRPPYWGPEYVLAEMEEGRTFSEIARAANQDLGVTEFDSSSWWSELQRWKEGISGFRDLYEESLRRCYEARGENHPSSPGAGRPDEFGPELQLEFIQEMMRNGGNPVQACYDVGISKGTVFSRLNPKSPRYDKEFADHFYIAEAERGGTIYQALHEEALGETPAEMEGKRNPILLRHLSETRMPHLFSPKRTLEIEGHVSHDHHLLPAAVTRQIAQTRQALLPPAKAEPEEEVVDAEYAEAGG